MLHARARTIDKLGIDLSLKGITALLMRLGVHLSIFYTIANYVVCRICPKAVFNVLLITPGVYPSLGGETQPITKGVTQNIPKNLSFLSLTITMRKCTIRDTVQVVK